MKQFAFETQPGLADIEASDEIIIETPEEVSADEAIPEVPALETEDTASEPDTIANTEDIFDSDECAADVSAADESTANVSAADVINIDDTKSSVNSNSYQTWL